MSGGVDSSSAAFLLTKNKKYEVIGCFIKGYNIDGCQEVESEDARRAAEFLKIPFYAIDLENEYKKLVVDYMIDGYKKGITPNPDVMCNKEIKFGLFLKKALEMGANYIASGHYVKIIPGYWKAEHKKHKNKTLNPICYALLTAKDAQKDQSYFLWTLTQEQLKYCLFPIGDYLKSEVRGIAKKAGLHIAEKKDSQGICFLGKITFDEFLSGYIPQKRGGIILASTGKKIGEHKGAHFYTIGQRHLGIKNYKSEINGKYETKPLYVVEKNIKKNILTVAEGPDNPAFYKKEIELKNVNFVNYELKMMNDEFKKKTMELKIAIMARVRYRQPLTPALLIIYNFPLRAVSQNKTKFIIQFNEPVKFIAAGQSAVFYNKNNELLGGGAII